MASTKEMSENCLRELRKNTEVLESTFERAGLQYISHSWQLCNVKGGLDCYVEVTGDPDNIKDNYLTIKANLYDADGSIIKMEFALINVEEFSGYETKNIMFYDEGLLFRVSKARIFAVRGLQNS